MKRIVIAVFCVFGLLASTCETRGSSMEMGTVSLPQLTRSGESATSPRDVLAQQKGDAVGYADVAGIFNQTCVMCHNGPKAPHGLRLDTYPNIMAGGEKGTVIVPGDPGKSDLLKRILGKSKPRMPLNGPPWLAEDKTKLIENWIKGGAPESKQAKAGVNQAFAKVQ